VVAEHGEYGDLSFLKADRIELVLDEPEHHKLRSGADDEQEAEGVGEELVDGHAVHVEGVVVEHCIGLRNAHVVAGWFSWGVLQSALLLCLLEGVVHEPVEVHLVQTLHLTVAFLQPLLLEGFTVLLLLRISFDDVFKHCRERQIRRWRTIQGNILVNSCLVDVRKFESALHVLGNLVVGVS